MLFTMLLDGIAFLLVFNGAGRYIAFLQLFTILLNDVERCVVFCVLFKIFGMRHMWNGWCRMSTPAKQHHCLFPQTAFTLWGSHYPLHS